MCLLHKTLLIGFFAATVSPLLYAQKQEVGLTLGGFLSQDRTSGTGVSLNLSSGTALQADYEYRFLGRTNYALYVSAHFLASPQRTIASANGGLSRDVASLYVTPGVMIKLFPGKRVIPWAVIGGGFGDYEQSTLTLDGRPNPAPRQLARGVFTYGGGVDVPVWRFVALRGEIRDFYTGVPAYNGGFSGGQHNVVAGGGIVLRFGGQ